MLAKIGHWQTAEIAQTFSPNVGSKPQLGGEKARFASARFSVAEGSGGPKTLIQVGEHTVAGA